MIQNVIDIDRNRNFHLEKYQNLHFFENIHVIFFFFLEFMDLGQQLKFNGVLQRFLKKSISIDK